MLPSGIFNICIVDKIPLHAIIKEKALRQAVSPVWLKFYRNRHRAGWRFLRFTIIVTVKGPICNVIRMSPTPFREAWPTACLLCCAFSRPFSRAFLSYSNKRIFSTLYTQKSKSHLFQVAFFVSLSPDVLRCILPHRLRF